MRGVKILRRLISLDAGSMAIASEACKEILRRRGGVAAPSYLVTLEASGDNYLDARSPVKVTVEITKKLGTFQAQLDATMDALPVANSSVNAVICLGRVINRCDVVAAMAEFQRVIRPGGYVFLDFESSRSFGLLGQKAFGRSTAIAEQSPLRAQAGWVYSLTFINSLLRAIQFRIVERTAVKVLLPRDLLWSCRSWRLLVIRRLDSMATILPVLTRWASNQFVVCQKNI